MLITLCILVMDTIVPQDTHVVVAKCINFCVNNYIVYNNIIFYCIAENIKFLHGIFLNSSDIFWLYGYAN